MEFRQDDLNNLTSRLLTVLISTILLTGVVAGSGVAFSSPDAVSVSSQDSQHATLSPDLQSSSGTVEVVVRLDTVELPETDDRDVLIEQMKEQTAESQTVVRDFATDTDGVSILGDFWLANAVLLEVDTEQFAVEQLTELSGVTQVHENEQQLETQTTPRLDTVESTPAVTTERARGSSRFAVDVGLGSTVHSVADRPASPRSPATPQVGEGDYTYGLELINVPEAWDQFNTRGGGATVAVLDTGLDASHPDLDLDKWAKFDRSGDRVPSNPSDFGSHGTHVTGTLAGGDASGTAVGVAPNVELLASPALGGGWGRTIAAMQWAVENDADVMNLSFGIPANSGSVYAPRYIEPIQNAVNAQTLVVTSAGNSGDGLTGSPANIYSAISVGNVDENGNVDSDSSGEVVDTQAAWGEEAPASWPGQYTVPNVVAPGSNVYSTLPDNDYGTLSGTSMAAPHVSGVAALLQSATDQRLGPFEIREILQDTADGPNSPNTREGYGIIDAQAALESAVDDPPEETLTVETAGTSGVGSTTATLRGELTELGGGTTAEVSFEYGTDGFTETTTVETRSSPGTFEATVDDLDANTAYQFRAVAQTSDDSDTGTTRTFTTDGEPTDPPEETVTVETTGTSDVSSSSATLRGALTELSGADSAEVSFEYGTDGFTETTTVETRSASGTFTQTIVGLAPDTEYQFRAVGETDGDSDTGQTRTFRTDGDGGSDPSPGTVTVETTDAFRVSESSATLVGELTELDGADAADLSFEYGTDGVTESTSVEQRQSAGFYQIDISGLDSGTEYQFRAVAEADGASDTGATKTFTTEGQPSDPPAASVTVETNSASDLSESSATLRGALTELDGADSAEVSFEYGTDGFTETTTVETRSSTGAFAATIDGLDSNTEYQFRAVGETDGDSDTGQTRTFRTTGDSGTDPSPGTVTVETTDAFRVSESSATLVGELTELDGAESAALSFEYGTDGFSQTTTAETRSSPGFYQVDVSGLDSGTEYQFRAVAQAGEESDTGGTKTFTTEGQPSDPPADSVTVETSSARNVGSTSATLRGTLTELDGADSAEVSFEYGTGSFSETTTVETRSSTGSFATTIDGLDPDTEYQFRAVGETDGDSDTGQTRTFRTESDSSDPPAESVSVVTRSAVDVSESSARLRGLLRTLDGADSAELTFEYGTDGFTETTTVGTRSSTGSFATTIDGLDPDTEYQFRAVGETDRASDTGRTRTFRTDSGGGTDPSPGTVAVETTDSFSVSESTATLVGEVTELEGGESVDLSFEYGTDGLTETTSVTTRSSPGFYQIDLSGLEPGTEYQFRAVAEAGGASDTGQTKRFTTDGESTEPPTASLAIETSRATDVSSSSATVRGALTELTGADSAEVSFEYGTDGFTETTTVETRSSTGAFAATIDGLEPNTEYQFRAVGETDGDSDTGQTRTFRTTGDSGTDPSPGTVAVETTDAYRVSDSTVTLVGELTELEDADVAELTFEYGTDGFSQTTSTVRTRDTPGFYQISLSGLESGTEYQFRAVATADGASDTGRTKRFTTDT